MLALTLIEAAKLESGTEFSRAIIELYSGSSSVLANLRFQDIQGNALKYNREANYPGVGFRGVNEAYTASVGVLNPLTEALVITGGDIDVDKFIVDTMGSQQRAVHEGLKVRALALSWTNSFINGNNQTDPRQFDGLNQRVTGSQLISAGATANGAALSLDKMDEAIDQCLNPTHILMSKAMQRKFAKAARTTAVSGNVNYETNQLGQRIMLYSGIPILAIDLDNDGNEILGFDEAAASGTDTATSVYVMAMAPDGLMGLQNGGIAARDLGELETQPLFRTRVEWYTGLAIFNGRAVVRLQHIGDLDIVA